MLETLEETAAVKDADGLAEIFQVPLNGSEAVPQLVGTPVQFITADLRRQKRLDYLFTRGA